MYVQNLIARHSEEVYSLLAAGALVLVCGDGKKMAPDVRDAFVNVMRKHGRKSEGEARKWLHDMLKTGLYVEDVWSG